MVIQAHNEHRKGHQHHGAWLPHSPFARRPCHGVRGAGLGETWSQIPRTIKDSRTLGKSQCNKKVQTHEAKWCKILTFDFLDNQIAIDNNCKLPWPDHVFTSICLMRSWSRWMHLYLWQLCLIAIHPALLVSIIQFPHVSSPLNDGLPTNRYKSSILGIQWGPYHGPYHKTVKAVHGCRRMQEAVSTICFCKLAYHITTLSLLHENLTWKHDIRTGMHNMTSAYHSINVAAHERHGAQLAMIL